MQIRKYKPSDRKQVENIHFETGFLGKSMSKFLSNNNLYKINIKYYLEKEPVSIFVVEQNQKVVGYLFGCLDDNKHKVIPKAILQMFERIFQSIFLPKKDRIYWMSQVLNVMKILSGKSGEMKFKTPKNAGHIHINILPGYRGKKYGTILLNKFEEYAKKNDVKIIHADGFQTRLNPNSNFWQKNGFSEYSKLKSLFWSKEYPNEDIYVVCYSKKII